MRIATYNIHGWLTQHDKPNVQRVVSTLAATGADIIGLNEVFYPRMMKGAQGPALEALADALDMHFVFGSCIRWPAQNDLPADAYGNALLSRWPIIASASHLLTPIPGKHRARPVRRTHSVPDQRTFTIYVTHLDHTDEEARASFSCARCAVGPYATATGHTWSWATSTLSALGMPRNAPIS